MCYSSHSSRNLQKSLNFGTIDQSATSIQLRSQSKPGASFWWEKFVFRFDCIEGTDPNLEHLWQS